MPRELPELPLGFRQTIDLYEVIYSIVYGAIFGALFPDYLELAHSHSVSRASAILLVALPLVSSLFGLSYYGRIRAGIFKFKGEALTIVGPLFAATALCSWLYIIGEWALLTLFALWSIPYLSLIAFGPTFRKGGWKIKRARKK